MPGAERTAARRRRLPAVAFSVTVHAGVVAGLMAWQPHAPEPLQIEPMTVALVPPPPPPVPPPPPEPPKVEEDEPAPPTTAPPVEPKPRPKPPVKQVKARPPKVEPPPEVEPLRARAATVTTSGESDVTDAELASAATAGSGGGGAGGSGAGCNMTRRVQTALRKSPLIQSSVAAAQRGKAIRVWNGKWVRHGEQEGAGLAAVREAILWEVGFAPEACKAEAVRGLVAISLNDTPNAPRIVVGAGAWRWKDLLRRNGPTG